MVGDDGARAVRPMMTSASPGRAAAMVPAPVEAASYGVIDNDRQILQHRQWERPLWSYGVFDNSPIETALTVGGRDGVLYPLAGGRRRLCSQRGFRSGVLVPSTP